MQKQKVELDISGLQLTCLLLWMFSFCELLGGKWCGKWLSWDMKAFTVWDILLLCLEHLCGKQNPLRWWLAWEVRNPYLNLHKETLNLHLSKQKWKSLPSDTPLEDRLSYKFRSVDTMLPFWIIYGIQLLVFSLVLNIIKMKYSNRISRSSL